MASRRVEWIDALRGWGIFLVFLGHTTLINKDIDHYIFSFHMPLFFFVSGLFYKEAKESLGFRRFFFEKLNARMVPYFLFGFLTYFVWLLPILLRKYGVYHGLHDIPENLFWKPVIGMFYGIGDAEWLPHNSIMWFLACTFVVEILFFLINIVCKSRYYVGFALMLFALIGYLGSVYMAVRLPFSIDVALTAVVFYGIGFLMQDYLFNSEPRIVVAILFCLFGLVLGFTNDRVDMNFNVYGNPILFYASSFLSIFGYIGLAKYVRGWRMVNYVGKNSLVFFLLQNVGFLIINVVVYLVLRIRPHSMEPNMGYACCYVLLSIIALFPIVFLIVNKIPVMVHGFKRVEKEGYSSM